MNTLNSILRPATAAVMSLFGDAAPMAPLALIALALGALAAVAFRYTSNQTGLKRVASRIRAHLLALRLFKDDTRTTFRAIGGLLGASMLRLAYSLLPMAILMVPFLPILAHVAMYYEFRPLRPGERANVTVDVDPRRWEALQDAELRAPEGMVVLARHRDPALARIIWVIRAEQPIGQAALQVVTPDGSVDKEIVVAEPDRRIRRVSPLRGASGFWDQVLFPGEPPPPAQAGVRQISVDYAPGSTPLLGWDIHWVITFLIVSIIGALLAKPFVKVQF